MFAAKNELFTTPTGYQIQRSLRFRSSASAYLDRTFGSGNRKTWTWSGWVKRGVLSSQVALFSAYSGSFSDTTLAVLKFNASNSLTFDASTFNYLTTSAVYRDPAAWYHVVLVFDTTNATANSRVRMYINGSEETSFSARTNPSLNTDYGINGNWAHSIGLNTYLSQNPLDGYLAEVNFIDGQALTPSSFGAINAVTGVWSATKYAGTYGTNGFYLNFTDNSAATAATIGKDYSGNGNNWTPNNISVTAGTTYDSMLDAPLGAGGGERGNYATLNPVGTPFANGTVTDGNLKFAGLTTTDKGVAATISIPSGTFYWESTQLSNSGGSNCYAGVILTGASSDVNANRVYVRGDGIVYKYGTSLGTVFSTFTNNDVIGLAYDRANNTLAIYKNGTLGYTVTGLNSADHTPWVGGYTTTDTWAINFGQRPFSYTPPTGFKALHTGNLAAPVIALPAQYMAVSLYTGTGATQTITTTAQLGSGAMVWTKTRSNAVNWDTRSTGLTNNYSFLQSNTTNAEETTATQYAMTFSNGSYTVGSGDNINQSARTFVGYQWAAGASASNTSGSITSTTYANTTAGFSVVTYTGTGANATVGHGLGVAPSMMIVKQRNSGQSWSVYHASLGATKRLYLDLTDAVETTSTAWNSTAPTSSVYSVGTSAATNGSGSTYVAYCFSAVAGYSAFGSYTGNGSTDGTFVFTNFRPRWVMIKRTDSANNWVIYDTARDTFNKTSKYLYAQSSQAEVDDTVDYIDIVSNGFKPRATWSALNASGGTYIYMAFAENPFKYANAR